MQSLCLKAPIKKIPSSCKSGSEENLPNLQLPNNFMTVSERYLTELIVADLMIYRLSSATFGIITDSLKSLNLNFDDKWMSKAKKYCRNLRQNINNHREFLNNSDMKYYKKEIHPLCNQMSDEIESKFGKQMAAMLMALLECENQMISQDSFNQLLSGIFAAGISWYRIGFMLTLVSNLPCLTSTASNVNPLMYIDWMVEYTELKLLTWIRQNHNWDGLADYLNDKPIEKKPPVESRFPTKLVVFIATCGVIGSLCLCTKIYKVLGFKLSAVLNNIFIERIKSLYGIIDTEVIVC